MSKNLGPGRQGMAEADLNLLARLASSAIRDAAKAHGGLNHPQIGSSIAKRLVGQLRSAFDMVPKSEAEPEDTVSLLAKVARLEANYAALERRYQNSMKNKGRQDRRVKVALEYLDELVEDGVPGAITMARDIRQIKE